MVLHVSGRVLKYAARKKAIQTNPLDHTEVEGGYANGDDDGVTPHPLTAEQVGEIAASIEKRNRWPGDLVWRTPVFVRRSWPGWKSVT